MTYFFTKTYYFHLLCHFESKLQTFDYLKTMQTIQDNYNYNSL